MKNRRILLFSLLLALAIAGIGGYFAPRTAPPNPPPPAKAMVHDYEKYPYGRGDTAKIIDVGAISNSISSRFTSECFFRDRILKQQLSEQGWTLREHQFSAGKDMLPYLDGRLKIAMLGDTAVLKALYGGQVAIFALTRQGTNSVIAKGRLTAPELKGLRIAYSPGTTAHFTLDQFLAAAHLSTADIVPVASNHNDELDVLLAQGRVDAVVTWEPNAKKVLASVPGSVAIFRGNAYSFIAADSDFAARHPLLLQFILAARLRASHWAMQDEKNLLTGINWISQANIRLTGQSDVAADRDWLALLRNETVGNPSFPMLSPDLASPQGALFAQFEFMKKIGLLPPDAGWRTIGERIDTTLLPELVREGDRWRIHQFDYAQDHLYRDAGRSP